MAHLGLNDLIDLKNDRARGMKSITVLYGDKRNKILDYRLCPPASSQLLYFSRTLESLLTMVSLQDLYYLQGQIFTS